MGAENKPAPKAKKKKANRLRYNKLEMRWEDSKGNPKNPPTPGWAVESKGKIPFEKFIRTWTAADDLEGVHKKFFWKSEPKLRSQFRTINTWLRDHGFQDLPNLDSKKTRRKKWGRGLKRLLDDGIVARANPSGMKRDKEAKARGDQLLK
jgi:hypothetical protein